MLANFSISLDISVIVVVDRYEYYPPMYNADSDWDYHGYSEMEWHLEDQHGTRLTQLEAILTDADVKYIEDCIEDYREEMRKEDQYDYYPEEV